MKYTLCYDKTKWHEYSLIFAHYEPDSVRFCQLLKAKKGWKEITFYSGAWHVGSIGTVDELVRHFGAELELDSLTRQDLDDAVARKTTLEEQGKKVRELEETKDIRMEIPGLKGRPYNFQRVGIQFFETTKGRALLADSCGNGKSLQALGYILRAGIKKTLIVTPASVKYSWQAEIKKWTELKGFVIDSKMKSDVVSTGIMSSSISIINQDILVKNLKILLDSPFEAVILDEGQGFKARTAQRSKAAAILAKAFPKVLILSGTPFLNRPSELWSLLNMIDPILWPSFRDYTIRYCRGHQDRFGWRCDGAEHLDELRTLIRPIYLRREKSDVLPELPPKQFIDVPIELSLEYKKHYNQALKNFWSYLKQVKGKRDPEIVKSMQAEKLVQLGELRRIASMGKVKDAEEFISNVIEGNGKVLVFSSYNEPLEALAAKFGDSACLLTGKTSVEGRPQLIEAFQSDPTKKVFFLGTLSGGVGINLTAASSVIHIDLPWRPADIVQANGRCDRPGQTASSIGIYQMFSRGTIDEKMIEVIREKQKIFDAVFAGGEEKVKDLSIINDVLARVEAEANEIDRVN